MNKKKDLEDKIEELKKKLSRLDKNEHIKVLETNEPLVLDSLPVGENKIDIKEITRAKNESIQQAGTVRNTDDGSVLPEDEPEYVRVPEQGIHTFENEEECVCECHPSKKDCMHCYDHPEHLERKRDIVQIEYIGEPKKKEPRFNSEKLRKIWKRY